MTAAPRIARKWRPPLGLVVLALLLAVLALPTGLIVAARLFDAELGGLSPLEIGVLAVALLLTLVIAYVLTRAVTTPIEALIERTREISTGRRDAIQPLQAYGTAEIATLSQSFLDLSTRLIDRTEYVSSFAAHVSHELKSPLTAIKGAAELMRDEAGAMSEADRQRFLDSIVAEADRLNALLARLRELAQAEIALPGGATDLQSAVAAISRRFPALAVETAGPDVLIGLPEEALAIVLGHLAANAAEHGATRLELVAAGSADTVSLSVADNGSGISPGNRDRIFDPFFTTRREAGGTGMGLDIARAMLRAHAGDLTLEPSATGARFKITAPRG